MVPIYPLYPLPPSAPLLGPNSVVPTLVWGEGMAQVLRLGGLGRWLPSIV